MEMCWRGDLLKHPSHMCGGGGFGCADEVLVCISCRTGRRNVRTASGLSTGIATATVSGLVAPNSSLADIGVGISAINSTSGRETTSGRDSGSGFFRRNFGFFVYVT